MTKLSLYVFLIACCGWCLTGRLHAATVVASVAEDLAATGRAAAGWRVSSAAVADAGDGDALPPLVRFEPMDAVDDGWAAADGGPRVKVDQGRLRIEPGTRADRRVVVSYTIQPGGAGFYSITDSLLQPAEQAGRVELRVFVRRHDVPESRQPEPAVFTVVDGGELFDFDAFIGYLDAGDSVHVSVGPGGAAAVGFAIERNAAIPVSIFSTDAGDPQAVAAPGGWSIAGGVAATPEARLLAWKSGRSGALEPTRNRGRLVIDGGDTVVAFRVPQSGYYALHDAWATAEASGVEARLYIGREAEPRRTVPLDGRASLNADLGYIPKGEVIHVAFAAAESTTATFDATVVEWAPRRAPLRVRRGGDGYLDVYAPDAPHVAIDIPKDRWLSVPAQPGDAAAAIRAAFEKAKQVGDGEWVGVRLQAGATYIVGSEMDGGTLFEFRDISRVVFDGNGATLRITSPELQRRGFDLFVVNRGAHHLAFADLAVEATTAPFTVGRIIGVHPKHGNTQTVTVQIEPGYADPLKEIVRDGRGSAYVYDPQTPGRLGHGTWSHYPGVGDGPQIKPAGRPGRFIHALTRTGNSLNVGDKWLVKNKGAGVTYLTTRGDAHDITLANIDGRAPGGGALRFWSTPGVNILDCRFEPHDHYWISSSADGVHGRGREGVWIEDTVIRGVCEDIMNTYGRTMAIKPDGSDADDEIALGVYDSSVRSGRNGLKTVGEDDARVGDRLVFFAPQQGRVLGYARVVARDGDRVKLSRPVEGLVPLRDPRSREATMVYSIDSVGNFVVRDSRFMDSMRIGVYVKARGGVVFGNNFEGLSAPGVFAVNEPEWPEGPPATRLWVQGNTFSQNNYGYMSRHRDFLVVDPADISVYTRRFRDASLPDTHEAFVTRGQYANSHVKIIGNTFHDWRGMGVAVRNARNVLIRDNLFLPPVDDPVLRETLANDDALASEGGGRYAAIFLDSVGGARISGNRFVGFPERDMGVVQGEQVTDVVAADNLALAADRNALEASLSFSEWFGSSSVDAASSGSRTETVELHGVKHAPGRLGAGLVFDTDASHAVLPASAGIGRQPAVELTLALWVRSDADADAADATQIIYSHGDPQHGVVIAIDRGRLVGGLWQDDRGAWLDLGPAVPGLWRHVALVFDGPAGTLRGYVDGAETASTTRNLPSALQPIMDDARFGAAAGAVRLGAGRVVAADRAPYRVAIDEFRLFRRAVTAVEAACLAMRRPTASPIAAASME